MADPKWDAFLSYAGEDRASVAEPLAKLLTDAGVRVWYDQTELKLGDSLRRKIDEGLAESRYGIVVLSPAFFQKHYPQRELDGLAQREVGGEKVLLPIWAGVGENEVRSYSPPLADRKAATWSEGLLSVGLQILQVVRPDIEERIRKDAESQREVPRIRRGSELASLLARAESISFHNDDPEGDDEFDSLSSFAQEIQDSLDLLHDFDIGERLGAERSMQRSIEEFEQVGWTLFGIVGRRVLLMKSGDKVPMEVAFVVLLKGTPIGVFLSRDDQLRVVRAGAMEKGSQEGVVRPPSVGQ